MKFGGFTLDLNARQLHRGQEERHLSPKAFDLLALLIANRPAVVDKEALRDRLWPGTNVVDANLNNLASEIRSALDDDAQQPQFLRTVHRVGYAFCGVVTDDRAATPAVAASSIVAPRFWLVWQDRTFAIDAPDMTIGRDPACQIRVDAPGVSRRHASIHVNGRGSAADGKAMLEDLGSTNGTFVDGRRVKKPVALDDGQSVRVGEATLIVRTASPVDAPTKKIKRSR